MTQAEAPARSRGGASLRARLFPGERRLWLCAAVVVGLGAVAILVSLLVPRDYYTGTNSVRTRGFPVEIQRGDRLCIPDVQVPAGTCTSGMHSRSPRRSSTGNPRVRTLFVPVK